MPSRHSVTLFSFITHFENGRKTENLKKKTNLALCECILEIVDDVPGIKGNFEGFPDRIFTCIIQSSPAQIILKTKQLT